MKYLSKNQTSKTIWKKTYPVQTSTSTANSVRSETLSAKIEKISKNPTHRYNVKLASWSRQFDFKPFILVKTKSLV